MLCQLGPLMVILIMCACNANLNISADVKKLDLCCVMERQMKATLILDKTGKFLKDLLDTGKGKHRADVAAPTFFLFFSLCPKDLLETSQFCSR